LTASAAAREAPNPEPTPLSMSTLFSPAAAPTLPIVGLSERFPVRRVYCIGRNYAEHAKEMGAAPDKGTPIFFLKPADGIVSDGRDARYPPATSNLHHEVELVLALGQGGSQLSPDTALSLVFGYAVGLDLTRRDLQTAAKAKGNPWDTGKSFDDCAPIGAIVPGLPGADARLRLTVNGALRQDATIADMLWSSAEILSLLSELYTLAPGDLIFTGTPAGVSALARGDRLIASLDGAPELHCRIV
jgi:fumarylpyruvate hydrolase